MLATMGYYTRYRNQKGVIENKKGLNKGQKTLDALKELLTLIDENLTADEWKRELRLRGMTWLPSKAAILMCIDAKYQWERIEIMIVDHGRQSSARYPSYTRLGEPLQICRQRVQQIIDDLVHQHKHATYKNQEYCLNVDQWVRILEELIRLDSEILATSRLST